MSVNAGLKMADLPALTASEATAVLAGHKARDERRLQLELAKALYREAQLAVELEATRILARRAATLDMFDVVVTPDAEVWIVAQPKAEAPPALATLEAVDSGTIQ